MRGWREGRCQKTGREFGGMLQGTGTADGIFKRRTWLKMGCCDNDYDDDDDDDDDGLQGNSVNLKILNFGQGSRYFDWDGFIPGIRCPV
jgi:hypothetical protein